MRKKITFFLVFTFSILVVTPTVISLIDDSQNVAIFLDINEEEDKQGKEETVKEIEIKLQSTDQSDSLFLNGIQKKKNVRFRTKNYNSQYSKNTTPPPRVLS